MLLKHEETLGTASDTSMPFHRHSWLLCSWRTWEFPTPAAKSAGLQVDCSFQIFSVENAIPYSSCLDVLKTKRNNRSLLGGCVLDLYAWVPIIEKSFLLVDFHVHVAPMMTTNNGWCYGCAIVCGICGMSPPPYFQGLHVVHQSHSQCTRWEPEEPLRNPPAAQDQCCIAPHLRYYSWIKYNLIDSSTDIAVC